jgi:hypothetical protein
MINFVSLNTIQRDLLEIIRGSQVVASENISPNQIEKWIHEYRAILLKKDIDRGKSLNPAYIQEIPIVKLVEVDLANDLSEVKTNLYTFRTEYKIPKTIDFIFKPGIVSVETPEGEEIQFVPQKRARYQKYKKYTGNDMVAYLKDDYIYIEGCHEDLYYVRIRGVFEVPTEVDTFQSGDITEHTYTANDKYPIPIDVVPLLKELILQKELSISVQTPQDTVNDSANRVQQNYKK